MKIQRFPRLLWIVVIVLLVAAVTRQPYVYYEILRVAVTGVAALIVVAEFLDGRSTPERRFRAWIWGALFLCVAVLFNPVHPFHLSRKTWFYYDLEVALGFLAHLIVERQGIPRMRK
jgi:hypothetical protein